LIADIFFTDDPGGSIMKKKYKLNEIDCANCALKLENAVKEVEGVTSAKVNYMMQKLTFEAEEGKIEEIEKAIAGTEKEKNSSMTFYGSSFITDETGTIVESASRDEEAILTHTFDLDALYRNRRDWGIFRDRRPEMYHDILRNDASKGNK
jgi:copper chaperone CopZ